MTASLNSIEVEIRFIYKDDIESKLLSIGSEMKKSVSLVDTYYDNEITLFLTINDYWLRSRKQNNVITWELKYSIDSIKNPFEIAKVQKYYEVSDEKQICSLITQLYKSNFSIIDDFKDINNVSSLIESLKLIEFAKIGTQRKVYTYENFEIDLDEADFGYKVGEIEFKDNASENVSVDTRVDKIEKFASLLGGYKIKYALLFKNRKLKG